MMHSPPTVDGCDNKIYRAANHVWKLQFDVKRYISTRFSYQTNTNMAVYEVQNWWLNSSK
jgi:hypothetical protein